MTRWLYIDPRDQAEEAERKRILTAIDQWWESFARHASDIDKCFSRGEDFDVAPFTTNGLRPVHPEFMWEYGEATNGPGHRLCITAEGKRYLHPLLDVLLKRAPAIPGWEFYPYRLSDVVDTALSIASQVSSFKPSGPILFQAARNDRNRIDLTFDVPGSKSATEDHVLAFLIKVTEHVAGDEVLDKWIGLVESAPRTGLVGRLLGRGSRGMIPVERLKSTVDGTDRRNARAAASRPSICSIAGGARRRDLDKLQHDAVGP